MTLQVVALQRWQGQEMRNVFHFAGGDATQANMQVLADFLRDTWETHMASTLDTGWVLYGCTGKDVSTPGNPTIEYALTNGVLNGTFAGEVLPTQNCLLVSFKALTARPNRARKYLAGLVEEAVQNGKFNSATITAAAAWGDAINDVAALTGLGLAHTVTRVDPITGVLIGSNILVNAVAKAVIGIQRRRRLGTGI